MNKFIKEKGKKVNLGLTNDNYLLAQEGKDYFIRLPKDDVKDLFNRKAEYQIIKQINDTDLSLPIKKYDSDTGILISEFIDNLITFDNYKKPDRIKKVVTLMNQFHSLDLKSSHEFDAITLLDKYHQKSNREFDLTPYQSLIDQVQEHQKTCDKIVCHNDWVEGNICFVGSDVYLIDFEYAGLNDPFFDIMSFYTENDLTEQEKSDYLNLTFPNGVSEKEHAVLIMYRDFNNLLWLLWAQMMYHLREEPIYHEIITIKEKQLTEEYQKELNFKK